MEAKRIPGKPGRTKRERVRELDLWWSSGVMKRGETIKNQVLSILDSPDEPGTPDMVQVTMTVEEAGKLLHHDVRAACMNNLDTCSCPLGTLHRALKEARDC